MYEYKQPSNLAAIKCSIMRRVREQQQNRRAPKRLFSHNDTIQLTRCGANVDNGLPSPPIEPWQCQDSQKTLKEYIQKDFRSEMTSALFPLSPGLSPQSETFEKAPTLAVKETSPAPQISASFHTTACTHTDINSCSDDEIREKIRQLQQEKHRLFQTMRDLMAKQECKTTHTSQSEKGAMPLPTKIEQSSHSTEEISVPMERKPRPLYQPKHRATEVPIIPSSPMPCSFRGPRYYRYSITSRRPPSPPRYYNRDYYDRVYPYPRSYPSHAFPRPHSSSSAPMSYMTRRVAPYSMPPRRFPGITRASPFRPPRLPPCRYDRRY